MTEERSARLREELAKLCHDQWTGWMQYLFTRLGRTDNGGYRMHYLNAEHWQRQMDTPYADLTEEEKDSDRKEADRFIEVFQTQLAEAQATITALSHEKQQRMEWRVETGLKIGAMLGPEFDGASFEEVAAALTVARARITQLSLENEQLNDAQSAREDTKQEGASQPLRADVEENRP